MGIFRKNDHFSNVLVAWGTRIQALVIRDAICKMVGSLGD
jgi:hypothetical protein